MQLTLKRRLAIGTTALAAVAFAGGAYAATQDSTANVRQAFLTDVAKRLKVTPQQLTAALQGAFSDQLSAAVASKKLTQAQADAIKQHAQTWGGLPHGGWGLFDPSGSLRPPQFGAPPKNGPPGAFGAPPHFFRAPPRLFGAPPRFFGGPRFLGREGGPLPAAAKYLGVSPVQLLNGLGSGKSLAQIAKSRGKTIAGLKAAMTAARRAELDKLRAAKMITSAQEQQLLSKMSARLDRLINHAGRGPRGLFPGRGPGTGAGAGARAVPPAGATGPAY